MSSNWYQQGPAPMGGNQMQQFSGPVRRSTNPPPVCFKCNGEHFLVNCPLNRTGNTAFAQAPAPYQQPSGPAPPPQQFPPGGPSQYPSHPPNQQYVPPASQYQYNQPQQPYTTPAPSPYVAPPSNPQYAQQGYQPPPYSQSNGVVQHPTPAYQPPNAPYNARGPSPYQAPVSNHQSQPNGYRRAQSVPTPAPYQPPQWNNPSSSQQVPFPKPSRNHSNFQRAFSGTPNHHAQQPFHRQASRSQSLQLEHPIKTPQTPSSQGLHGSPVKARTKSISSTTASHVDNRRGSSGTIVIIPKPEMKTPSINGKPDEAPEDETEEGEVGEEDEEEDIFRWELEHIFIEPPAAETVALAQPLSAGYESTPVPLVQAWTTNVPSISRYARENNLKEFIRTVRVAPQWSYLQEDPAFAELSLDGESIPLSELGVWMDVHHGRDTLMETAEMETISKKRSRSDSEILEQEDQQEDVDQQIALEVATEQADAEPPNKRQKNDDVHDFDVLMRSGDRTPVIVGRSGTPCTTDDAWAPEPGETATSPGDPTENLLASLGVSGDPKPRKQASPPQTSKEELRESPPTSSQMQTAMPSQPQFTGPNTNDMATGPGQNGPHNQGRPMDSGPQGAASYGPPMSFDNGPMPNNSFGQGPQPNGSQAPSQGYMQGPSQAYAQGQDYPQGYAQGPPQGYPQGPPQGLPQGPPQVSQYGPQYGPVMNAPYSNGPSQNMPGPPQYGPPVNVHSNGPPSSYTQGQQQWGPQRNPSYGSAPPYNSQPYPQYGPPQNVNYGNANYGPPTHQYQAIAPAQYPQGPPQHNQARQPSYGSGPPMGGQYGPMAQNSPVQYGPPQLGQYQNGPPQQGPPQNVPYNSNQYPNQPQYQNGSVNGYVNGPPQGPPNNVPYGNMPPNPNMPTTQMPYSNTPNGYAPPRQDSGYVSERGSYSNGSGPNGFNTQSGPQIPAQQFEYSQPSQVQQPFSDATNKQSPMARGQQPGGTIKVETSLKEENSVNRDASLETVENDSSGGTPLSPTSAELLGTLMPPDEEEEDGGSKRLKATRKPTRVSLGRKVKKPLRPQPVVEPAYSRRW